MSTYLPLETHVCAQESGGGARKQGTRSDLTPQLGAHWPSPHRIRANAHRLGSILCLVGLDDSVDLKALTQNRRMLKKRCNRNLHAFRPVHHHTSAHYAVAGSNAA